MSIATRIESIEEHIEQAYDELQGLGADLTNVNKNIDNIASVLDDIYDDLPKVTGSGTSITLDDTRKGRLESTLKGNTSQESTTGINLAKVDYSFNQTTNGITCKVNSDGSISLSGTASANTTFIMSTGLGYSSGAYAMSCVGMPTNSDSIRIRFRNSNASYSDGDQTNTAEIVYNRNPRTITNRDINNFEVFVFSGVTLNSTIKVQLQTGSSATSFEPYTNGASPNPSYPQPVNVVSGDNEISVVGKNLLDYNNTTVENYFYNARGVKTYDSANEYVNQIIQVIPNTSYTFSSASRISLANCRICQFKKDGTFISRTTTDNNLTYNFTTNGECSYVILSTDKSSTKYYTNVQFEKGSVTNYEPYQGNTYNIDLPVENLVDTPSTNSAIVGSGLTYSRSEDGTISVSGTSTRAYDYTLTTSYTFKAGETYTFYCERGGTIDVNYYIQFNANNGGQLTFTYQNPIPITRTIVEDQTLPIKWSLGNNTTADYSVRFMVQKGSKANSFTPYGTTPIELCKIGNYQDYFYKDSGKWYLHKEIGKYLINHTTTNMFSFSQQDGYSRVMIAKSSFGMKSGVWSSNVLLLTHFVQYSSGTTTPGTFQTNANGNNVYFYIPSSVTSLDSAITYMDDLNCIAYAVQDTSTNTEITYQPLIDQLNLLEKAMSKDGQTNISQINNDLPFIISASALKEWQENTSLNSTLSMVNPLSLGNTLNTQEIENNIQPIEVDNIEPLEEEENEES